MMLVKKPPAVGFPLGARLNGGWVDRRQPPVVAASPLFMRWEQTQRMTLGSAGASRTLSGTPNCARGPVALSQKSEAGTRPTAWVLHARTRDLCGRTRDPGGVRDRPGRRTVL